MIKEMKLIPVTENSYPFQAAAKRCGFETLGYAEDEYFMTGTANLYTEVGSNHEVDVLYPDAPYTTRILIRRPKDPAAFSGNVVIEILNASAMMDIDRMWVNLWQYMTRNGDIYVGITSKGHVVDTLKRFNPERYAPINWANPLPDRKKPDHVMFQWLPQYESGLYWDMQNDLAKLLRTADDLNPLKAYAPKYLYLAGWSQSGSYMSRTVNSFAYRPENIQNGPLFDGYLEAGADSALAPVNAFEIHVTDGVMIDNGVTPKKGMIMTREPYIAINTESENRGANWAPDSDAPGYKFRAYEIPCTSHDAHYNMIEYYEGYLHDDAARNCCDLRFEGLEGEPLDTPYQYIFQAALRNLYVWVREGVPAPHAPRIETRRAEECDFDPFTFRSGRTKNGPKSKIENVKDLFGNSKGGIRMACADYAVARYTSHSVVGKDQYSPVFGTAYPFPAEMLKQLYGSLEHYRELVEKSAERTIAEGFLLKEDKEAYVERTVEMAARRGLV